MQKLEEQQHFFRVHGSDQEQYQEDDDHTLHRRCTFGSSDHFCSLSIMLPCLEPQQLGPLTPDPLIYSITLHTCFSVNQEIMSNYVLLACTLLVCGTGTTQLHHSLLEAAAARGLSLPLRYYNLVSEEECSNRYCHSVCLVHDKKKYRRGAYCTETRWECCCPH